MFENKLISVIIPVYNVEKYLKECIDSVLNQTYQSFEIILVDDGSTDSSGVICDMYACQEQRIRVIHQENGGLSAARNKGFSEAIGEYVYFLDSDDWLVSDTLDELISIAQAENSDVIFFDAISFMDGSNQRMKKQNYIRKYNYYKTGQGYYILGELQKNNDYHSAVPLLFMRREFLKENDITFEDGILYEDMIFTYQVFCKAKKVSYCMQPLYQRRYRTGSIMTSCKSKKNFLSASIVYEKVRDFSEENNKIQDDTAQRYISRCAFNALNIFKELNIFERKECKEKYKALKVDIKEHHAYGNRALYMRCHGTFLWFCFRAYEKLFVR